MQPHWVGDLTLETNLEITKVAADASVRLELIKAGLPHRCTIDLATGTAVCDPGRGRAGQVANADQGTGRFHAPVCQRRRADEPDRRRQGNGRRRSRASSRKKPVPIPTAADLAPAAIAVRNASVVASDLVLKRDIYYTQTPGRVDYGIVWEDRYPRTPKELFDFLSDPTRFRQPRQRAGARVRRSGLTDFSCSVITARAARIAAAGDGRFGVGRHRTGKRMGGSSSARDRQGVLCVLAAWRSGLANISALP